MYRSRELSRCCGAGGGYKSQYGDYAVNIAVDRIADAEEVGAELIITSCPFCVLNLRQGAKKAGSKIKVLDLSEVLLQVTAPKEEKKEDTCAEVAKPAVKKPAEVAKVETTPKEVAKVETTPKEVAKAVETPKEVAKAVETPKEVAKVETTPKEVAKAVETPKEVAKVETTPDVAKAAPVKRLPDWVKNETEEVYIDDYTDYTPEAVVRRAAWNNGLRCRRDYGDDRIPVAFVKGKVAVFVESADADKTLDNKLKAKGWTVLRYNEDDITDGEKQGEEIAEAVKENLKAAKKKKR